MLARLGRSLPLALALSVVLSLVAVVDAAAEGELLPPPPPPGGPPPVYSLVIVAPISVTAGNAVTGYVTGHMPPVNVVAADGDGNCIGQPVSGIADPTYFSFPTDETMIGDIVFVTASDSFPHLITHGTVVQ